MKKLHTYEVPAVEAVMNYIHRILREKLDVQEACYRINVNVGDRMLLFFASFTTAYGEPALPTMYKKLPEKLNRAANQIFGNPNLGLQNVWVNGNQVVLVFDRAYFADEDIAVYTGQNFNVWQDDGAVC